MHTALLSEQSRTADLENNLKAGGGDGSEASGLIGAIRKGQMRHVVPNTFNNMQIPNVVQPWARAVKEFVYWHHPAIKLLIEYFEGMWTVCRCP